MAIKLEDLYKLIMSNAIIDRDIAINLFLDLKKDIDKNRDKHMLAGPIITKYIERSNRANDQLIALAKLIQGYDVGEEEQMSDEEKDKILDEINNEVDKTNNVIKMDRKDGPRPKK